MTPGESSQFATSTEITETACIEGAYGVGHARIIIPLIKRCGLIRVHKISLLSLLFMFACHPAQFITQEASTDCAQSSGGPGTHTHLWRGNRGAPRPSLYKAVISLVFVKNANKFTFWALFLLSKRSPLSISSSSPGNHPATR